MPADVFSPLLQFPDVLFLSFFFFVFRNLFNCSPLKVIQLFLIFTVITCYNAYSFISSFCTSAYNSLGKLSRNVIPGCRVYAFNILTLPSSPPKKLYQFKFLPTVFYCFNLHFPIDAIEHLFMCLLIFLCV